MLKLTEDKYEELFNECLDISRQKVPITETITKLDEFINKLINMGLRDDEKPEDLSQKILQDRLRLAFSILSCHLYNETRIGDDVLYLEYTRVFGYQTKGKSNIYPSDGDLDYFKGILKDIDEKFDSYPECYKINLQKLRKRVEEIIAEKESK